MTVSNRRARAILGMVMHASEGKARKLYEEVYGAQVGSTVPVERVRASIVEALHELMERRSGR